MPVRPGRALRRAVAHGEPLPPVPALSGLAGWGVEFRRGQLVMVTGRPKAGKSNFIQALVEQWRGIHTLYHCWDMPAMTAISRQAAAVTGDNVTDILHLFDRQDPAAGYYEQALDEHSLVEFSFDRKPDLAQVGEEIDAWVEKYDSYPDVMVCDNLLNIDGAEEDHREQKRILREFQSLTSNAGILTFVLHHAKEGTTDTARPPKAKDTDGMVNQIPDLVLSLANDGQGSLYASPVAARNGRMDPNAENPVRIPFDLGTLQFKSAAWRQA